jgi:hypothetical protein
VVYSYAIDPGAESRVAAEAPDAAVNIAEDLLSQVFSIRDIVYVPADKTMHPSAKEVQKLLESTPVTLCNALNKAFFVDRIGYPRLRHSTSMLPTAVKRFTLK